MSVSRPPLASAEPWPWRRALAWLVFLAPFFFITYGFANWSAAQRAYVPSLVFAWETAIPFWAWTIVPYWSIDALYGVSLLVCMTRRELDTHARRLLTAQAVAFTCFVLVPLRFTFTQPDVDGVYGWMFAALAGFDQPFNQLPSLHIALAVILWALYVRRLSGIARLVMEGWFLLICGSVLTTYQHHFIDLPTGLLLGALCLWAWPLDDEGDGRAMAAQFHWTRDRQRWRLAALYAAGALLLALIAITLGGWALWLLWGSVSLLLVALAYAAIGAATFQKRADGRLSVAARWLLAPYRAAAWLNSRAWTWRHPQPVPVADGVYLGRIPSARELAALPVKGVVDLTAEFASPPGDRECVAIPVLDLTAPPAAALGQAAEAIERLRAGGPVLVCCALGRARSACAVAAWLLASGRSANVASAVASLRATRAVVMLGDGHAAALHALVGARSTHPAGAGAAGSQ